MRHQIIPDPPLQDRYNDDQRPKSMIMMKGLKIQNSQVFFQGQDNLNTGRVAGYYYNIHDRVAFKDPLTNQALEDKTGLLNQIIQNCN